MMKIFLNYRSRIRRSQIPDGKIIKEIKKIMRENEAEGELSITFCDDEFMRKLNKKYRNKNKTTDVLSFELGDKGKIVGDVYISVPTAKRQAKEYNTSLMDELAHLASHGTLHVLGYTHKEMGAYGR